MASKDGIKSYYMVTCKEQGRNLSIGQIQQALKDFIPTNYHYDFVGPKHRAAILLPLFCQNDVWHILFTRRTNNVYNHKGQVSFPGGAMEAMDVDLIQTALRESYEEIGIKPEDVEILGRLGNIQSTSSGYLVTPFIGVIPWPYEFNLSTDEVEKVFSIPLEWLSVRDHYEERNIVINNINLDGVVFFQDYEGEVLWGLTARIVLELMRALKYYNGN